MAKSPIHKAGPYTITSDGDHLHIVGGGISVDFRVQHITHLVIPTDKGVLRQLAEALTEIADEQDAAKTTEPRSAKRPSRRSKAATPTESTVHLSSDDAGLRLKDFWREQLVTKKRRKRPRRG